MMKNGHITPVRLEVATAEEIAARGLGTVLRVGISETAFGYALIGEMPRGICHLSFFDDEHAASSVAEMQAAWPLTEIAWDHSHAAKLIRRVFAPVDDSEWSVYVRGTPFQVSVWNALLTIPFGTCLGYGALATAVGKPKAVRAVGTAVGKNEVSFLIPCHRVILAEGNPGQYRWGALRKRAMLEWENSRKIDEPTHVEGGILP